MCVFVCVFIEVHVTAQPSLDATSMDPPYGGVVWCMYVFYGGVVWCNTVYVCICDHFQWTRRQPVIGANPVNGQLNRVNSFSSWG